MLASSVYCVSGLQFITAPGGLNIVIKIKFTIPDPYIPSLFPIPISHTFTNIHTHTSYACKSAIST